MDWIRVSEREPPQDEVVLTKIHDENGERNVEKLRLHGRLWFFPDMTMYVYYVPTHWKPVGESK